MLSVGIGGTGIAGGGLLNRVIAAIRRNNGVLYWPADNQLGGGNPNLLSAPEFAAGLTDAPTRGGLITLSSLTGYDNAIAFGHDGSTTTFAYKNLTTTNGLSYVLSVLVEMTDGLAPTFGNATPQNAANTFALAFNSNVIDPTTYTVTALGGTLFRVSMSGVSTGTAGANWGVVKYAGNNNRTFKVTGYKLELGSLTAYTPQAVLRSRGAFTDSTGLSPVTVVGDVLGKINDRCGSANAATQATTASKPLIQRVSNRYVMSFDGSNDSLTCGLSSGGSPFVRSYTTTGTVSGFTSATTTTFVMGQPTLASRNVCMIVGAPNTIPAADLLVIERFAQSVGATL